MDPPVDQVLLLRAIYQRAADLHAALWCNPVLIKPNASWMRASSWYRCVWSGAEPLRACGAPA